MSALKEQIAVALKQLENGKDKDWTENGRPSLTRVRQLAKNDAITQEELDEASGDLKRDFAKVEGLKPRGNLVQARKDGEEGEDVSDVWVVATDRGYYGGSIREPGEAFAFTGKMGRWMRAESAGEKRARLAD